MKKIIQLFAITATITLGSCIGNSGKTELSAEEIQANIPAEQTKPDLNDPAEQAKFSGAWIVESLNGSLVEITVGTEYIISGMDVARKSGTDFDTSTFTAQSNQIIWAFRGNKVSYNYAFEGNKLTLTDATGASAVLVKQ
jgi:hypothetical protein